jgi:hypothetical protein
MIDATRSALFCRNHLGERVRYQTRHMPRWREGTIVGIKKAPRFITVLLDGNTTPEDFRPEDLYWPPEILKHRWFDAKGHYRIPNRIPAHLSWTDEDGPLDEDQPSEKGQP